MRIKTIYVVMAAMLFAFASLAAWPQGTLTSVNGTVKDGDKPLADAQVVLTFKDNGKTFKAKTDKNGAFTIVGLPRGIYQVDVFSAGKGENLYEDQKQFTGEGGAADKIDINVAGAGKKMSKEEVEKIKAENAKATSLNELINKYNVAQQAQNWKDAEDILKQMVTADPNNWRFYQALGGAQMSQSEFEDAVGSYDKGIQAAQSVVSGTVPKDARNPDTDPIKAKAGLGQMLASQGNAYLKLKKTPEAVAAFTKAAELDPNPGLAYFNLCATQYNTGNTDGALAACDKAITADPKKADAYFIKGSLMMGAGKLDAQGKYVAPTGTAETLNKYLELSPDGPHAADVKEMLGAIGAKIETSYKGGKKK
jgi:tetratricopeptide (TPR) repeat protein